MLKLGRDERFDVLTADDARGGGHTPGGAGTPRGVPCRPCMRGDRPRGQVVRLQVETLGRRKCAKLSSAGGVWCGLAEVLDSTLCDRCARPAGVTGNHKIPGQITEDRPR